MDPFKGVNKCTSHVYCNEHLYSLYFQVFPLTDTWYVTYRNYEEDPVFGVAKCLRTKQDSPETESGYPIIVNYDGLDEPM